MKRRTFMKSVAALMGVLFLTVATGTGALANDIDDITKAIKAGDVAKVEAMLAAGFDVNTPLTGSKSTPLLVAAAHPKKEKMISVLIAAGADVNYKNTKGKTALKYAKDNKARSIMDMLKAAGATE